MISNFHKYQAGHLQNFLLQSIYISLRQADFTDLLVEVLVSLLQVKENLFSTFGRRSTRDPITDASQKQLEERLQLYLIFS